VTENFRDLLRFLRSLSFFFLLQIGPFARIHFTTCFTQYPVFSQPDCFMHFSWLSELKNNINKPRRNNFFHGNSQNFYIVDGK